MDERVKSKVSSRTRKQSSDDDDSYESKQLNEQPVQARRTPVRSKPRRLPYQPPTLSIKFSTNQFRQQHVPSWTPNMNCLHVGRFCLIMSILLVPLGTILLMIGLSAKELRFPYGEECKSSRNYLRILRSSCFFCGGGNNPSCTKEIEVPLDLRTPVYLYYEIENFQQNHRFLIRSMDNLQLRGKILQEKEEVTTSWLFSTNMSIIQPSRNCGLYRKDRAGKIYFPCGSMANAMFTDDFTLNTERGFKVPIRNTMIAWPALKKFKYKNSEYVNPKNYHYKRIFSNNFVKPKDWTNDVWDEWWKNGGLENEHFINWMVPSHSSTVRKLYGVIDSVPQCAPGIFCKGNYSMQIEYRFDVDSFKGSKAIILSVPTFMGTRNLFIPLFIVALGVIQANMGFRLARMHEQCIKNMASEKEKAKEVKFEASKSESEKGDSSSSTSNESESESESGSESWSSSSSEKTEVIQKKSDKESQNRKVDVLYNKSKASSETKSITDSKADASKGPNGSEEEDEGSESGSSSTTESSGDESPSENDKAAAEKTKTK